MTEETRESFRSRLRRPATLMKAVLAFGSLSVGGMWWGEATNLSPNGRSKPAAVSAGNLDKVEILKQTQSLRERFINVMQATIRQDKPVALLPEEVKLLGKKLDDYEILREVETNSGFYGLACREKSTGETPGKIVVTFGSGDTSSGPVAFMEDLPNMFFSTTGGRVNQLPDAKKFAEDVIRDYGKIDYLVGHSLGAHLAVLLTGMGIGGPEIRTFSFDGPGVVEATISHCCDMSGLSPREVEKNFRTKCISYTGEPNAYNRLGIQAGKELTPTTQRLSNSSFVLPAGHMYSEMVKQFYKAPPLVAGDHSGISLGPAVISAILAMACLPLALEMKKAKSKAGDVENSR